MLINVKINTKLKKSEREKTFLKEANNEGGRNSKGIMRKRGKYGK